MMRAFTLVELLSVLVILSLVVGVGAQGLASSHSAARFREAIAAVRDLDRQARILARTSGPIELSVMDEGRSLTLLNVRRRRIVLVANLPQDVRARIDTTGALSAIVFDRAGRTVDYQINIRSEGRSTVVHVSGLTGQVLPQSGRGT